MFVIRVGITRQGNPQYLGECTARTFVTTGDLKMARQFHTDFAAERKRDFASAHLRQLDRDPKQLLGIEHMNLRVIEVNR